jgi:hypothetical protein
VAYAFAVTEEGVVAERRASVEHAADSQALVVTEEGAVVAGVAATEDEAVAGAAVLTPTEESGDAEEEKKEE